MNISICITTLNEESSIGKLLDSLLVQTKKADEIIIVDGGSTDKTLEIIRHYQKKVSYIKLLKEKCTRARGRNLGVEIARNEIIAITDAGCVAHLNWLDEITRPFKIGHPPGDLAATLRESSGVDIAAGFYRMVGEAPFQKAAAVFLGTTPDKFDNSFLPSTRSMGFRKSVWEKIGGFPEEIKNSAEDTYFNYQALKFGVKYARVKSAVVEWGMPESMAEFGRKIYDYAKWDAKTKIFIYPQKGLTSHNVKAVLVILRYLLGLILLILGISQPVLLVILVILFLLYLVHAFRKAGAWGIPLQIISDFAVMLGFLYGIF